jgi:hypothetical protein
MTTFKAPDLKQEILAGLKPEYVAMLDRDERAAVEVSSGEMGNKPDAVKLGWLKMRTGEPWTKQRYTKVFKRAVDKLRSKVAERDPGSTI